MNTAIRQLRAAGVPVRARDAGSLDAEGTVIRIATTRGTATAANAADQLSTFPTNERVLFAVDRATPSLINSARSNARLVVVDGTRGVIWNGAVHDFDEKVDTGPTTKGPQPYARYAIARALLAAPSTPRQSELALRAGVTQSAASKALARMSTLVQKEGRSLQVTSPAELFDWAVTNYPGPGGITTYWWKDTSLRDQGAELMALNNDALISGDLAASRLRGWRQPEHVTLYARKGMHLSQLGYVFADGSDYTAAVTLPRDETLWATAASFGDSTIADPIITAFDVARTGTTGDELEAASILKEYTLDRLNESP